VEKYGRIPEKLADYGDNLDTYQSIGISTTYAAPEKHYKTKRKYGK
jgi:hypothetical protein